MPVKSRTEELRTLIKQVREGEFDYKSRESPKTNWNLYDYAQIKEFANYLENLRDLVDEANKRIKERSPPKKQGVGRPPTDPADIAKILLKANPYFIILISNKTICLLYLYLHSPTGRQSPLPYAAPACT